ncbi:MAG: GldG family protein [Treponema sp.]|nr:GldG family protein [Treponema sp.]
MSILFFLFFNNAHLIAVSVNLPNWIISLCKEFSFEWHFDACSKGIIDSRDFLFYIASCLLLVFASVAIIKYKRRSRNLLIKKLFLLASASFVLILLNSSKYFFRIDITNNKKFSVSPYSSALLSEINEPLKITYYLSPVLKNLYPQVRDVNDFIQTYASKSNNVFYEVIDPVKNHSEKSLAAHGIRGEQIQTSTDSTTSYTTVYSAVIIQYLENTEIIPFVLDTKTLEYDMTSRIQYLSRGIARNVQIAIGNGLSLESDYNYIKPWLESQGFSVYKTYFPSQASAGNIIFYQIPDVPLLVLGTSECTQEDADALSYFIQRGGKALIATTPYCIDIKNDWEILEKDNFIKDNVVYMLQQYGIYFSEGLLSDTSCFSLSMANSDEIKTVPYSLWPVLKKQANALNGMTLFWPCSIETDSEVASEIGFKISKILHTSPESYLLDIQKGTFITNPFSNVHDLTEKEKYRQFDVCVELTRDNRSKCIVLGDQYAMNSNLIAFSSTSISNGSGQKVPVIDDRSLNFLSDCFLRLCNQEELLSIKNKVRTNMSLYKTNAITMPYVVFFAIIVPSLLILSFAIVINIKRYKFNKEGFI